MTTRGSREAAKTQNEARGSPQALSLSPPSTPANGRIGRAQQHTQILTALLLEDDNKFCSECHAKGPRWASTNLGVFFCIRCSGIHRNLGVHISKVRSINLDTWSAEQIANMQQWGNSRAALQWEFHLPEGFHRPAHSDAEMEAFIRAKYERKKYARKATDPELPPAPQASQMLAPPSSGIGSSHHSSHHGHSHGHGAAKKPEQRPPLTLDSLPTVAAPVTSTASAADPAAFVADFAAFSSAPAATGTADVLGIDRLTLGATSSSSSSSAAPAAAANDLSALFGAAPAAAPAAASSGSGSSKGAQVDIMSLFGSSSNSSSSSSAAPMAPQMQPAQQQMGFGGGFMASQPAQPQMQPGFGAGFQQPMFGGGYQQQGMGGFQQQSFGGFQQQQQQQPQQPASFGSFQQPVSKQANPFADLGSFGTSSSSQSAGSTLTKDLWK